MSERMVNCPAPQYAPHQKIGMLADIASFILKQCIINIFIWYDSISTLMVSPTNDTFVGTASSVDITCSVIYTELLLSEVRALDSDKKHLIKCIWEVVN